MGGNAVQKNEQKILKFYNKKRSNKLVGNTLDDGLSLTNTVKYISWSIYIIFF